MVSRLFLAAAALQLSRASTQEFKDHVGDDQVGALYICAPVRALRSYACCRRFACLAAAGLDRRCDGVGALRCHGFQSTG